jgi:hypothetical protein
MVNRGGQDYSFKIRLLAKALLEDQCLIFLGAGASRSDNGEQPALPTALELGLEMAKACQLDFPSYLPLSTIAFYFEFFFNRAYLNDFIRDRIDRADVPIPKTITHVVEIVRFLEQIGKSSFVITTNYDRLFERAYEKATGTKPCVITYHGAWDPHDRAAQLHSGLNLDAEFWRPTQPTTLYKMHGCVSDIDGRARTQPNLVVTEEDYINFLTNALSHDHEKSLLQHVRGLIALSNILFLGYSLTDPNFRVVFKATAESRKNDSYAVQFFDDADPNVTQLDRTRWESTGAFWRDKKVQILNARSSAFTHDLLLELQRPTKA